MKKNRNIIFFALLLLAASAGIGYHTSSTCKETINKIACPSYNNSNNNGRTERIFKSDIPFLESLTRYFLTLYH